MTLKIMLKNCKPRPLSRQSRWQEGLQVSVYRSCCFVLCVYLWWSGGEGVGPSPPDRNFSGKSVPQIKGLFQLIFVTPPWMSEGSDFPPGKWNLTTHPQETLVCRKYPWKQSENVCLLPRKWGEQEKTLWKTKVSLDYSPPGNIFSTNTPWKFLQALSCPLEMLKYPPSPQKILGIKCSPSPRKSHSSMRGSYLFSGIAQFLISGENGPPLEK